MTISYNEPPDADLSTSILHVDVDAFFASVEQLLIPRLRGKPVVVGNGVIASCSYEARKLGLHAGTPLHEVRRLCPRAVILDGQQATYRCFAEQIWDICRLYTDGLETFLDEAYGDIRGMQRIHGRPMRLGEKLRAQILEEVGLSVSVGLASNRMLSKMASQAGKPGGVVWIPPGTEEEFLTDKPVQSLLGVGHKTHELVRDLNIRTIGQLRGLSRESLRAMLGERGEVLYERCRGRDAQEIVPRALPRTISRETTFHQPLCDLQQIRAMLSYLLERAMRTVRQGHLRTRTVALSIRYDDWKQVEARQTLPSSTEIDQDMLRAVYVMLERLHQRRVALRHVGIVLSNFSPADHAPTLFEDEGETRARSLHETMDAIRDRWGHSAVVKGDSIALLGKLQQNDYGFVLRTPSLTK